MEKSTDKKEEFLRREKDKTLNTGVGDETLNNGVTEIITKNPGLILNGKIERAYKQVKAIITALLNSNNNDNNVDEVLLIGPTGTAKTLLARQIAYDLNIEIKKQDESKTVPLIVAQCNQAEDFYGLFGHDMIVGDKNTKDGEKTIFVDGPLVQAVKCANDHGFAILLLDEINALKPENQKLINPLLDGRNEIAYDDKVFRLKEGAKLFVIGTMNIATEGYYGISGLNDDLKRRFGVKIILDYPEENDEIEIIKNKTGSNAEELIKRLVQLAKHTRGNAKEWDAAPLTTANLINFIKTYEINERYGNKATALKDAFESTILNNYYEEGEAELRRSLEEKANDLLLIE